MFSTAFQPNAFQNNAFQISNIGPGRGGGPGFRFVEPGETLGNIRIIYEKVREDDSGIEAAFLDEIEQIVSVHTRNTQSIEQSESAIASDVQSTTKKYALPAIERLDLDALIQNERGLERLNNLLKMIDILWLRHRQMQVVRSDEEAMVLIFCLAEV